MPTGTILSSITLGFTLFLGFWILIMNPKNKINQSFFLLSLSISAWVICNILADLYREYESSLFFAKMSTPFIALIPVFFILLVSSITKKYKRVNSETLVNVTSIILLVFSLFFSAYFQSNLNIASVKILPVGISFVPGIYYYLLLVHLIIGFGIAIYYLFSNFSVMTVEEKKPLKILVIGVLISVIFGIITGIIFPVIGYSRTADYTPSSSLVFIFSVAYAITQHQLFKIKSAAIEVTIFALWTTILTRAIFSSSVTEGFALLGFLLTTIIFGITIIRSMRHEIKQRQKIETLSHDLQSAYRAIDKTD